MFKKAGYLIVLLATLVTAALLSAQDAKLVDAATKEGRVTVYGSLETDTAEAVFKIFKQKTGIEVAH